MTLPPPPWATVLRRLCADRARASVLLCEAGSGVLSQITVVKLDLIAQAPGYCSKAGLRSAHTVQLILWTPSGYSTHLCFSWAPTNQPSCLRLPRPGIEPRPLAWRLKRPPHTKLGPRFWLDIV